jgi:peptide/nickel transport system permease protein
MAAASVTPARPRPALRILRSWHVVPVAWLCLIVVGALLGMTVFADRADESSVDILQAPSASHPMGTDELGRDVFARVLAGASVSLQVSLAAVAIGLVVGGAIGMLAAVSSRLGDEALMRTVDVFLAFPAIVLALLVSLLFGTRLVFVALIIGIVIAPQVARLVRARLRIELREGYVVAERSTGASRKRILLYHVGRNVAAPIAAYCLLLIADAMLFEAALSYIGIGVQPPQASWGNMILDGQRVLISGYWWISVFPGIALFLTVASLNLIADRAGLAQEQAERSVP